MSEETEKPQRKRRQPSKQVVFVRFKDQEKLPQTAGNPNQWSKPQQGGLDVWYVAGEGVWFRGDGPTSCLIPMGNIRSVRFVDG